MFLHLSIMVAVATLAKSWLLPPAKFVTDFALLKNRMSITFHLPNHNQDKWIKTYRSLLR